MFDLTGKTALVTGASGGIGSAIAKTLHKQGAQVVISGTKLAALEELSAELNTRVHFKICDLKDTENLENLITETEEVFGNIGILVCNAGITRDSLALRMKTEDFEEVLQINLVANFALNRAAIKRMIKNKWGRVINISSIIGVTGNAGQANYAASKAGLIAMSKSLAQEVASRGVTVNAIAPGFIKTAMTDVLKPEIQEKMIQSIPAGKFGLPEDIAAAVAFLASEEAHYITGQTIHVNGGMLMV
jgi:3-oxoacyl-[acyl-carrier protein] reductase